jgi:hypothetical protein
MGLEAECNARVGKRTSAGKALLETERLIFQGEFRLDIPFDQMKSVTVDGAALVLRTDDGETRLELGAPLADRWSRLIKEPKGLFEKLEVGPESRVAVVDVRDTLFLTALRERTASVAEGRVPEGAPLIFFGADTRDALRKVQLLRARLIDTGALWIVRPKGSKAISEADVFEAFRTAGLVDTKVVAFSKTHTAHKAVIPVEMRGRVRRPPVFSLPPPPPGTVVNVPAVSSKSATSAKPTIEANKATVASVGPKPPAANKVAAKTKKRR